MARVRDIKNRWGISGGEDPQRSDLWQVDLSDLINGLNQNPALPDDFDQLPDVPRYYPCAVSLPELRVKAEVYRRDSRSYQMPAWDDPLDAIRISFIMDASNTFFLQSQDQPSSLIYKVMDIWRMVCRAGRGALSAEQEIMLNENYQIEFRYPIYVYLCRGSALPPSSVTGQFTNVTTPSGSSYQATFDVPPDMQQARQQTQVLANRGDSFQSQLGIEVSGILRLDNCWLSGFKVGDLTYDGAKVQTIDANIYAENLLLVSKPTQSSTP